MGDNFRNKQWFKNMSSERKQEICDMFDIDEKTLRKCGRANANGTIMIDLLRIDTMRTTPKSWNNVYKKFVNIDNFTSIFEASTYTEKLDACKAIYEIMNPKVHYLKYKDNIHNNLRVNEAYTYMINWLKKYINETDIETKMFNAHQTYSQVKYLIESDLKLVK